MSGDDMKEKIKGMKFGDIVIFSEFRNYGTWFYDPNDENTTDIEHIGKQYKLQVE